MSQAAARFHNVVTSAQLRACGLGPSSIAHRVRRGWLTRIFHGVYRVGPVDGWWTPEAAALLACGDAAVLSHGSSAAVCGMRARVDGRIDVTVARGHRAGHDGIVLHHARLAREEVWHRSGLRITSPARTLRDLAATLSGPDLERTLNEALVLELVTASDLRSYLARSSRHTGAGALRALLQEEAIPTRSELERRMAAIVRRLGLPVPQTNVLVEGHLVDFYWPDHRLVVETDGYGPHGIRPRFESDRARDAHLTALGYRVLRFTWRQVVREPDIIGARLAAALARA